MKSAIGVLVLLLQPWLAHAVSGSAACAVFDREMSFALSVDQHDADAFRRHLHPGTVFSVGSGQPIRGADQVAEAWAGFVRGEPVMLRWRPQFVDLGGEPDLAASSGPYLMRRSGQDGSPEYATGRFSSVWKRMPDGEWYVLFDGGTPPQRITAEQADSLFAALPERCPYAD